jgi:nucleoid DNA-binding protein
MHRSKKNCHRNFIRDAYGINPLGAGACEIRKTVRGYTLWIFDQLSKGNRVCIHGVGTITATIRNERQLVGNFKAFQPKQYVLKFKASPKLQPHLKNLAKEHPSKTYFNA